MAWRTLAICAVLMTACSIPVPPREAFPDQNADILGADAPDSTSDTSEVTLDAATDTLDVADATSGETSDTLEVSDAASGETTDALEVADATPGETTDALEVADTTPGETTDALEVADSTSDATSDALDIADGALDTADSTLDAADVDLCTNVTCTDLACATQACNPATGKCVPTDKIDGWACNDGLKCTENDACASGVCTGAAKDCGDSNSCTNDSCNASLGCVNTVVKAGTACDDGDACTTGDLCVSTTCTGTAGLWEKTFGGGSDSNFQRAAVTTDGVVAVGSTWASFTKATGPCDFWLVKTDFAGKEVWAKTYGGAGSGWAVAVAPVADGYGVAGFSQTSGVNTRDGWLIKTNLSGTQLWSKTFGGTGVDQFADIVADGDGFVAVGKTTPASSVNSQAWVVRVDGSGSQTINITWPSTTAQAFNAIVAVGDGFAAIGTTGAAANTDVWVVRLDSSGNILWQRTFGGNKPDRGQAILALTDGYAIGGTTESKGAGASDFWLIRTDAFGQIVWDQTYGDSGQNELHSVNVLGDGFVLTGDKALGGGISNAIVIRTDGWGNAVGTTTYTTGMSVRATVSDSSLLLSGETNNATGITSAWLKRTDLWGNTSCAISGACSGYTNECDDNNPCTADLCGQGKVGCWHTNLPDASPCSSGDACLVAQTCTAGACGGGGAKLFDAPFTGAVGAGGYLAIAPGGFLVAGSPKIVSTAGDVRLVRTDGAGAVAWDKTYDLGSYDGLASAVVATSSGFAVAGSVGSDTNGENCFLLTTDAAGTLGINAELGDTGNDYAYALAAVADGYALAGATMSLGATTQNGYLVRTDAAGAQLWQKSYDGANVDAFNAIAALPDGFALAGRTGAMNASTGHAWLVRTDTAGVQLWAKTYAHGAFDAAHAVVATADGFFLAGETTGAGASDMWLIRTDASGVKLWSQTFGTSAAESASGLSMDNNGLALVGNSGGNGYVVRTDWDGNKLWDATVGAGNSQTFQAIAALSDGFAITGSTNIPGSQSFWLRRTDLWGNASCAASGTCAALNVSDCDDSNPCTADLCNAAKTGCWHANMSDGTACGYGATCGAGVCTCAPGYVSVTSGDGKVCAADGPVWGNLPYSPAGFADNSDGTVSDTDTGLTWQQADPAGVTYTWDQANQFCITSKLANQSDWRLPTLAELSTLIDFNKTNPATSNLLQTNVSLGYWSATPLAGAANNAWTVSFVVGTEQAAQLSSPNHVRCVRGTTASQPSARFSISPNTVTDTWTGLNWQRVPDASPETTVSAQSYCTTLAIDGQGGWRIPNIVELRSLVDRSKSGPAIDTAIFPGTTSEWFWASGSMGGSSVNYWSVYFSDGKSEGNDKVNTFRVRCVK